MIHTDLQRFTVAPPRPVAHARARWTERHGLLLTLTDGALFGQGECSPLPGYSPDTLDACEQDLLRALRTHSPPTLPSARFALDCARRDLDARRRETSFGQAWADGASVRRSALAGVAGDPEALVLARDAIARGCTTVKVKIGAHGAFARELEGLHALREAVGDACALRLDANGAWSVDEARVRLEALAAVRPELVEQPVAGAAVLELGACAVPWAADECLQDPSLAARLLRDPPAGCVAVVLKPPLIGDLDTARAMALQAQRVGLGVIFTHLFDGPLAVAAVCALATSLPVAPWPCGLDLHPALAAWGVLPPQLARDGWITPTTAPGTGLPRLSARQIRTP